MENVVLVIHLLLALALIGIVLVQRSEGGMGSLGGGGGAVSGRAAATALGKLTWLLAAAFICTSIALTVIAAKNSAGSSVVDRLGGSSSAVETPADDAPVVPAGEDLLPPTDGSAPAAPPRAD
ncbi:MAG: preprotein translocase subunit SecG [Brevirhabdus sp.]